MAERWRWWPTARTPRGFPGTQPPYSSSCCGWSAACVCAGFRANLGANISVEADDVNHRGCPRDLPRTDRLTVAGTGRRYLAARYGRRRLVTDSSSPVPLAGRRPKSTTARMIPFGRWCSSGRLPVSGERPSIWR